MVLTGIDNLSSVHEVLMGKRIGLMTNPTGVTRELKPTIDVINERYRLTALFACEHGVRGDIQAGVHVETDVDPETGVTMYSVHGKTHHLTDEMLDQFDVLVFDMQDVGVRFYTYLYSLSFAMEDCARAGKPVVILDRPNPQGGLKVAGTLLDERVKSFIGEYAMPTRYGMTIGEYARWVRDYLSLELELYVAPMKGWSREMLYEDTGLCFVPPSPNCATLHTVQVYTGTCLFEGTNLSEGRGTVLPFEYIGAPFIDPIRLEKKLREYDIQGIRFRRTYFTPQFNLYAGTRCAGVQIHVTDRINADTVAAGLYLVEAVRTLYPEELEWTGYADSEYRTIDKLLGTDDFRLGKMDAATLLAEHKRKIDQWQENSKKYWLYS